MADINDLIQKLSFYQAGGKDPGTSTLDKLNTTSDIIGKTVSDVLAIKKQQLEGQKTAQETQKLAGENTPYRDVAMPLTPTNSTITPAMSTPIVRGEVAGPLSPDEMNNQNKLNQVNSLYAGREALGNKTLGQMHTQAEIDALAAKTNEKPISVKLLPTEAKNRALAAGYTENDFLEPKLFNAIKGVDPYAPVQAMGRATANALGQVPGNAKIGDEPTLNVGERQDQFWQRQWTDFINKNDPASASSRSVLGVVGKANLQANRAQATLMKPTVTKQEAGNVMADIAAIYQGGAPTQFGMQEQGYRTLYGNLQNALQSITGSPTDVLPNDIKQRLLTVLKDMKSTNSGIIADRVNLLEKTQPNLIKHFPQEFQEFKTSLVGGNTPASQYSSAEDVKAAVMKGQLSKDDAHNILKDQFGYDD